MDLNKNKEYAYKLEVCGVAQPTEHPHHHTQVKVNRDSDANPPFAVRTHLNVLFDYKNLRFGHKINLFYIMKILFIIL